MKCTKCNFDNSNNAKFCMECGTPMHKHTTTDSNDDYVVCPSCGGMNADTAKFCRHCGTAIVQAATQNAGTTTCPKCHGENTDTAKFCRHCGASGSQHESNTTIFSMKIELCMPRFKGTFVVGTIESGIIRDGDVVDIMELEQNRSRHCSVKVYQMGRFLFKPCKEVSTGEKVGILLKGIKDGIKIGQFLVKY